MEFGKKLALLLLLSACSNCLPSRPLNDRPSELTWQAWLLVDSQNQLQNESDRRITPKSVFIAPKLNGKNVTLPDCAEGYKSDAMGRCIPLIKVDEAAHLNFLLQKLNQLFPPQSEEFEDEEIEDESMPTAGPLQVNIPLGQVDDSEDVSMVDASANGQFNEEKINVKRHPDTKSTEEEEVTEPVGEDEAEEEEEEDGEREDYRDYDERTEENETTTQTEQTTVTDAEETSTIPTTTTEEVTETTEMVTTTLPSINEDLKALFFLMPENNTKEVQAVEVVEEKPRPVEVETIVAQTSSVSHSAHRPAEEEEQLVVIPESNSAGQFSERWKEQSPPSVVFGDDVVPHLKADSLPRIEPLIFQTSPKPADHHQKFRFPETTVRFPETTIGQASNYYTSQEIHHKPQSGELTEDQIREFQKLFIQRPPYYDNRRESSLDLLLNHRNRDRHGELFNLSPTQEEIPNKPIRVSRYPPQYHPHGFFQAKHHEMQYYGDTGQDYSSTRKRRRGGHLR